MFWGIIALSLLGLAMGLIVGYLAGIDRVFGPKKKAERRSER